MTGIRSSERFNWPIAVPFPHYAGSLTTDGMLRLFCTHFISLKLLTIITVCQTLYSILYLGLASRVNGQTGPIEVGLIAYLFKCTAPLSLFHVFLIYSTVVGTRGRCRNLLLLVPSAVAFSFLYFQITRNMLVLYSLYSCEQVSYFSAFIT